ncbi:MAG: class I SAM-dependent methyltransferase [Gammaproteobacteria bacterium]|nr:class I SAM-dependent methyltransferase [Gammaproteobacteria bacterium]
MIDNYYLRRLSGNHLKQVYDLADSKVVAYLKGEIEFCRRFIAPGYRVLELGCGYGRILKSLASSEYHLEGIDNAPDNIELALEHVGLLQNVSVRKADVTSIDSPDNSYDLVLCMQNGLSAFGNNPLNVVRESCRVLNETGKLICCTYSEKIWPDRLKWFREQSNAGLLSPVDEGKTGNNIVVCQDGFTSSAMSRSEFKFISNELNLAHEIYEIESGSLICEFRRA